MKPKNRVQILLSLFLIAGIVFFHGALGVAEPRQDDNEIQVSGSFFHAIGSGSGLFNADLAYGYFVSPEVEVGLRQGYNLSQNDDSRDVWNATTVPFVDYHFAPDRLGEGWPRTLVPFLGGFIGLAWNDSDSTGTMGPEGGLKWYLNPNTFLAGRYRYEWFFDELSSANETQDSNHVVLVSLGYKWGGVDR